MTAKNHGAKLRGLDAVAHSSIRDARFGRMFRNLAAAPANEEALLALAGTLVHGEFAARIEKGEPVDAPLTQREPNNENPGIPAGYTYLGQFIDHDITFDPVSSLDRFNDPDALTDFRTPRLDLDSVYGAGPADQPYLYAADGAHFLLGDDKDFDAKRKKRPDLPRNNAKPRRALIGDPRNDENIVVSQLHAAFLRFHNAVLDRAAGGGAKNGAFEETQRLVRWHYQWIVLHDYLRRIVGEKTYKAVVGGPRKIPKLRFYESKGRFAFMPVEFSVAAFRFGHSQVRPSYALNRVVVQATPAEQPFGKEKARFNRIPIFSNVDTATPKFERANLNGFRGLPDFWAIDWGFFLKGVKPQKPPSSAKLPQPSYRIDTLLVDPLASLPGFEAEAQARRALAARNLLRGWRLGLPSGQAVARRMGIPALSDAKLFAHAEPARQRARRKVLADHPILAGNAPLWFYILREAELIGKGAHLGPVGGTIVAEVLAGLMLEDRQSFLAREPRWRPTLPAAKKGDFTIADLINFADR